MNSTAEMDRKLRFFDTLVTVTAIFLIAFVIGATSTMTYLGVRSVQQSDRIEAISNETHRALCALKTDIQTRLDNLREFRAEGRSIPGITDEDLAQSESNYERTIKALRGLDCVQ